MWACVGFYSKMQALNSDSAIHAADDALAMGCNFNRIGTYSFENFPGKLKSFIQTAKRLSA